MNTVLMLQLDFQIYMLFLIPFMLTYMVFIFDNATLLIFLSISFNPIFFFSSRTESSPSFHLIGSPWIE